MRRISILTEEIKDTNRKYFLESMTSRLNEAAFRSGMASKMIGKIASVLSKRIGIPIGISSIPDLYKDSYGTCEGYFGFIGNSKALRLNFLKGKSDYLRSIDIYDSAEDMVPSTHIDLEGYNIVQVIDQVTDIITGEYERYDESFKNLRLRLEEKLTLTDMVTTWLQDNPNYLSEISKGSFRYEDYANEFLVYIIDTYSSNKKSMTSGALKYYVKQSLQNNSGLNVNPKNVPSVSVHQGTKPELLLSKENQALWDEVQTSSPKEIMEILESDVRLIANDDPLKPGLLVYGKPGTGKTQLITDVLGEEGVKPIVIDDKLTAYTKFIMTMYEYRDGEIILIDDNDSIFDTEENVNLLKKLLDMKPVRKIRASQKVKVPGDDSMIIEKGEEFEFTSRVIFISNKTTIDTAIVSRLGGVMHEVNFSKEEILDLIKENLSKLYADIPTITDDMRKEVYDFIESIMPVVHDIDYRAFNYCLQYREAAETTPGAPPWKKRSMKFLKNYMKKHDKKKF